MSDWRDPNTADEIEQSQPLDDTQLPENYGTLSEADAGLAPAADGPVREPSRATPDPDSDETVAVTSLVKAIETRMDEVRQLGEDLTQRESSMTERVVDLDRRSAEMSAKLASIDADRAQLAAHEMTLRDRSVSVERQESELRRRMEEAETRLSSIEARESELAEEDAALCNRAQSLDSKASTVREHGESISSREQAVGSRARALTESEHEIRSLKKELRAEREKVRDASARLKQEQAALTEMKSAALDENDKSMEDREHDLAKLVVSLDLERERIEDQWREFETQKNCLLDGSSPAITSLAAQQQFDDRERELESARLAIATERERLDAMTQQLQIDRESIKKERSSVEVDRDRGAAMNVIGAAMDKTLEECRIRRVRLRGVRTALREREIKLQRAREIIRDRHKECERILAMRDRVVRAQEEIEEQRESIARSEDRSRVSGVLLKFVIAIAILGGLSWAVADRVAPTMDLVRATIVSQASSGELDQGSMEEWSRFSESLSMDPRLIEETAARLKRRGVEDLQTPGAVSAYFKDSLNIDSQRPGELTIALKGEGGAATRRILETYLASFVAIANDARAQRADQASTVVSVNATVDDVPLRDDRLKWAGAMWGGATLLFMLIGWALWSKLAAPASRNGNSGPVAFGVG